MADSMETDDSTQLDKLESILRDDLNAKMPIEMADRIRESVRLSIRQKMRVDDFKLVAGAFLFLVFSVAGVLSLFAFQKQDAKRLFEIPEIVGAPSFTEQVSSEN